MNEHFCPDWVVPPGETIKDALAESGMSQHYFGLFMNLKPEQRDALLSGEMEITDHIAAKLHRVFGPPPAFWLNLERTYRAGPCRRSHAAP